MIKNQAIYLFYLNKKDKILLLFIFLIGFINKILSSNFSTTPKTTTIITNKN